MKLLNLLFGKKATATATAPATATTESLNDKFMSAVRQDNLDLVIKLKQEGADVSYRDRGSDCSPDDPHSQVWHWDYTPLDIAQSESMKTLLLHWGAKTVKEIQKEEELLREEKRRQRIAEEEKIDAPRIIRVNALITSGCV